jgi:integrase
MRQVMENLPLPIKPVDGSLLEGPVDAHVRDAPVTEPLAEVLAAHGNMVPSGPSDPVFPGVLGEYEKARTMWRRTCLECGLHNGAEKLKDRKPNATLHDLRHTYGVMAAQGGVPIVRLQKLMGHSTPHMTMRYMKHAPGAFFKEDAEMIARAITGGGNEEQEERSALARRSPRSA